jgi:hypothetical protein
LERLRMNERIKKLAEQAKIEFTYDPTETPMRAFVEAWEDELGKFAELIVNQCADIAQQHNKSPVAAPLAIGYVIREHFGVEE